MRTVYFDYNATTPLDPAVRDVMLPFLGDVWGNPSSVHHIGRRARALLDEARDRVAGVWGSKPSEVIFTSGGTEASNLAIFGAARLLRDKGRHLVTSRIEHHAVLHCFEYLEKKEGFQVTWLPVNAEGVVEVESLARALRPDTVLVSVMAANNETGAIQPMAELGQLCRDRGVLFHTDAVQWFGKEPFENIHQFHADLVSCCAHKFHGPKGAGALFIRSPLQPDPILVGGGHENERRAGTENLASIIGFAEATERFVKTPVFTREQLGPLTDRLVLLAESLASRGVVLRSPRDQRLAHIDSAPGAARPTPSPPAGGGEGWGEEDRRIQASPLSPALSPALSPLVLRGEREKPGAASAWAHRRLANTVAFTVRGTDSMTLLAGLDLEGICASSGSACSAGSLEPSHVMVALGAGKDEANGLVRFSLGRDSTAAELSHVECVLPEVIARAQQ